MKKITFLLLGLTTLTASSQIAFQGFESSVSDTWNYSSNITPYNLNTDTDLWTVYTGAVGNLGGAYEGTNYWAGRDLDNPFSEGETGSTTPEHHLEFDAINIGGNAVTLSFMCEYEGYDSSDYFFYELAYDNGSDWTSPDVHVDVVANPSASNVSSVGNTWESFTYEIPSGNTYVRLRFGAYQNGASDYLAFDNISLNGATLSSKKKELKVTYGPNPVKNILKIQSEHIINKISVYNTMGAEVITKTENSLHSTIHLENLTSGIYFVKVKSKNQYKTLKIVKQ